MQFKEPNVTNNNKEGRINNELQEGRMDNFVSATKNTTDNILRKQRQLKRPREEIELKRECQSESNGDQQDQEFHRLGNNCGDLSNKRLDCLIKSERKEENHCLIDSPSTMLARTSEDDTVSKKPELVSTDKQHLLMDLFDRSTYPTRINHFKPVDRRGYLSPTTSIRNYAYSKANWNISNTVKLQLQPPEGHIPSSKITCIEFDKEGVLLAVSDNKGIIRIFDFDEVNAKDLALKNKQNQIRSLKMSEQKSRASEVAADYNLLEQKDEGDKNTHVRDIYPIITHSTSFNISCVKWNPSNEDQLAVSFLGNPEVHIYDIESMQPLRLRMKRELGGVDGNKSLLFNSSKSVTACQLLSGSIHGTLKLWEVPNQVAKVKQKSRSGKLIWSVVPWKSKRQFEGISEIKQLLPNTGDLNNGLILVAGDLGSIALIDINKCTHKAFSAEITPQVLRIWQLSQQRDLCKITIPDEKHLGIVKICMWENSVNESDMTDILDSNLSHRLVEFSAVIKCGWVMTIQINATLKEKRKFFLTKIDIIHKSVPVTFLNSQGEQVEMIKGSISLPRFQTPACCISGTPSIICVGSVRPVCQVIPDKDHRVLNNVDEIVKAFDKRSSPKDALLFLDRRSSGTFLKKIRLKRGVPQQFAIHPNNDWIVMGYAESRQSIELLHA